MITLCMWLRSHCVWDRYTPYWIFLDEDHDDPSQMQLEMELLPHDHHVILKHFCFLYPKRKLVLPSKVKKRNLEREDSDKKQELVKLWRKEPCTKWEGQQVDEEEKHTLVEEALILINLQYLSFRQLREQSSQFNVKKLEVEKEWWYLGWGAFLGA